MNVEGNETEVLVGEETSLPLLNLMHRRLEDVQVLVDSVLPLVVGSNLDIAQLQAATMLQAALVRCTRECVEFRRDRLEQAQQGDLPAEALPVVRQRARKIFSSLDRIRADFAVLQKALRGTPCRLVPYFGPKNKTLH